MSIQELIELGFSRKVAKQQDEYEASERQAWKEQQDHAAAWLPILQRVEKYIPAELAHALTTPIHPARASRGGMACDAPFTLYVPGSAIRIKCDPETRWRMNETPVFCAMRPASFWDDENNRYYVEWQEYGEWTEDFLIALAEGSELAEQLPAVVDECQTKNAEWQSQPKPEPEPAQEYTDWLNKAIEVIDKVDFVADEFAVICVQTAQAHALISIAQELRVFNYRSKRGG